MGTVELLSREGEIAIAKRIEAGREAMIAGLCESPLTFQAVIIWRDELNEGKVFLRDIIDLEATYAGPDAKQVAPAMPPGDGGAAAAAAGVPGFAPQPPQAVAPPSAPPAATPFKPQGAEAGDGEEALPEGALGEPDLDEDDLENSMSLAAIEAELKPKVLETFDTIADTFKRLRRLQEIDIQNKLSNEKLSLSPNQERKYRKLKEEIIQEVKSLRLNQARIAQHPRCGLTRSSKHTVVGTMRSVSVKLRGRPEDGSPSPPAPDKHHGWGDQSSTEYPLNS